MSMSLHSHRVRVFMRRLRAIFSAAILLYLALCAPAGAQDIVTDERSQGVAQAVFGIVSYTRWPVEHPIIRLCVVGPTEYADEVLKGGLLPGERKVMVRRIRLDDPALTTDCEGVYVGLLSDSAWRQLVGRLDGQALLSISERQELCQIGGMFCLDVRPGNVTFEVNLDSVARSGVRVNPRVLRLARRKGGG